MRTIFGCCLVLMALLVAKPGYSLTRICNYTNSRLFCTFMYFRPEFGYLTRGWWTFENGTCGDVPVEGNGIISRGAFCESEGGAKFWGGSMLPLCKVNNGQPFRVYGADRPQVCNEMGGRMVNFGGPPVGELPVTWTLHP